jgi:hypothetical protein
MRTLLILCSSIFISSFVNAQLCRFEKSNGKETATYFEAVEWYKTLDGKFSEISVKEMGLSDAGYPLHLVTLSKDKSFDPLQWKEKNKVVLFILNGIHPGEPDGIDASMMMARDLLQKKVNWPGNIVIAIIPVYNIGGALNRSGTSRVNQNGPSEYGFRGNAQNLDLNRDFTKCDSRNARSFAAIFQYLQPDVFLDTHVSDGADYQHTITLITTQYNKLGGQLGEWLKNDFEPQVYSGMKEKKWDLIPYVDFANINAKKGIVMFNETPRYSSGYAAMFNTLAFISETHMLKPYAQRVQSTYDLINVLIQKTALNADTLLAKKKLANALTIQQKNFALKWVIDTAKYDNLIFKGYESDSAISEATGLKKMLYNRQKPFTKNINYFNTYKPVNFITKPTAYIIAQGWYEVIDLLKINGVHMQQLPNDTSLQVTAYHIDDYSSYNWPYEKHHKNTGVITSKMLQKIKFLKGDYLIYLNQKANRFLVEMLEPTGEDSYFSWNFFDAILQQKEGYSDYRWEEIATEILRNDTLLQKKLSEKKSADPKFAANASAILDYIYKHSPYYEPAHLRYPVYRLE